MTELTASPITANDVDDVVATLDANRGDTAMFLRSRADVTQHLSDFIVAREPGGRMLGCSAVHAYTPTVTEILSVSVLPSCQGRRIGQFLVEQALERARAQGAVRIWLATSKPRYFSRFGFEPISRWDLPATVLIAKLRQVFDQPPRRWLPALFGRFTFMECRVPRGSRKTTA